MSESVQNNAPVSLPEVGFLRLSDVLKIIPVAKTAWYQGVKEGRFPSPVKLTKRASGYRAKDIRALIDRLEAGEGA
ncbi:MAG: AlpA family phage regulatory protein [Desulfovibrio sp.]|uniref:helix-turn-helix transcriptional regulator n=1 Tax=Desulfovibrio sp. TaxID=885 RepID=UPI0025C1705C|nr:AlpA family phage regulatory protein [Desulfovibrio sp.]MCI7568989.1 AlpA family phage regulatory protein [Desulfovibrio sp.]